MAEPTTPIAQRLVDLGTELDGHIGWLIDRLAQADVHSFTYQMRDERRLHWRASGKAEAYREVLTEVFGFDWVEIHRRATDRAKAAG